MSKYWRIIFVFLILPQVGFTFVLPLLTLLPLGAVLNGMAAPPWAYIGLDILYFGITYSLFATVANYVITGRTNPTQHYRNVAREEWGLWRHPEKGRKLATITILAVIGTLLVVVLEKWLCWNFQIRVAPLKPDWPIAVRYLLLGLVVPVVEEYFFRYAYFRYGTAEGVRFLVPLNLFVFLVGHGMGLTPDSLVFVPGFAVVFGFLQLTAFVQTRSLLVAIAIHAANNLATMTFVFADDKLPFPLSAALLFSGGLVAAAGTFWWVLRPTIGERT